MSTSASPASLLQAVAELARLAGDVAHGHARGNLAVEYKGDGSPVTAADRAAETVAREWIRARFPQDGILGEEFGVERPEAPRRWIMDPIDGTKSFVAGVPLWGTLIAVAEGDTVLAGAAYFPPIGELVAAAPGEGCWWNERRCRVSNVATLADATVLTTDERFESEPARGAGWRRLAAEARVARTWGDCFGYLLVATGRAEVMVDPIMSPWDSAALQPIITEAGGTFTSWDGDASAFAGSVIATNAHLADVARARLATG